MAFLTSAPSPFASAPAFVATRHGRGRLPSLVSGRQSRKSLRVSAILSSGPRAVEHVPTVPAGPPAKALSLGAPLPEQQPAFERDSVVAHAGGDAASDAAVPMPEPQPTPQIDVNWLNAMIDSTVKVG